MNSKLISVVHYNMDNYLYKYGNVEVYNKFEQPTRKVFHQWRREFLESVDVDNYNILFMGNTAEIIFGVSPFQTKDIDIILSGEIDSYKNLSHIMNTAFKTGLNYNLCIDIFHLDIDVFQIKWWDSYKQIRFYDRIETPTKKIIFPNKIEDLPFGLFKFAQTDKQSKSHKKHHDRIKSGQYLGLRFDLKTMRLISFN